MKNRIIFAFMLAFCLVSCHHDGKVDTTSKTVNFTGLNGNDIYLVKVNKSNAVIKAMNTGGARALRPESGEELLFMDYPAAVEFNANPLPLEQAAPRILRNDFVPPVVGDTRNFWVEITSYERLIWAEKQATLMATGNHGNIWVMDENASLVTAEQAEALAEKFDLLYPATTNILGFEYGGGPDGDGGMDGDPKIQILVYNIASNTTAGYFWGKDLHPQSQLETYNRNAKTNLAEIIYLDAREVKNYPEYMYSTMIHELQHMINYNVKWFKHRKNSATWYDEMLSKMAEDIIAPLIGVDAQHRYHPISECMPRFLVWYDQVGITEWDNSYNAYSKGFSFGAYLLRNYGGARLLKNILANNATNIESITAALNETSPGMDFEKAFDRFGEAMIYSGPQMPENVMSFDKTVTTTINDYTYTAYGFDIWNDFSNIKGGLVFNLRAMDMRPYSISIHTIDRWKNISGDFSITLETPQTGIELHLLVK